MAAMTAWKSLGLLLSTDSTASGCFATTDARARALVCRPPTWKPDAPAKRKESIGDKQRSEMSISRDETKSTLFCDRESHGFALTVLLQPFSPFVPLLLLLPAARGTRADRQRQRSTIMAAPASLQRLRAIVLDSLGK